MATLHKPAEYKAIALWGANLGSFQYYIKAQQEKASRDGAPVDSLYFSDELGRWIYVRDLKPDHHFHAQYAKYLEKH